MTDRAHSIADALVQARARETALEVYLDAIRTGSTEREAAAKAGRARTTIASWIAADPELVQREEAARTEYLDGVRAHVERIAGGDFGDAKAAAVQVKAATWLLEKRDPDRFGQRVKQEHTGANGGPITLERAPTAEEARAAAERVLAATKGGE